LVLFSCDAEFDRRQSQGWEDPRSGVGDEENYEEFKSEESKVEDEENYEETDDRPYLLVKLLSQLSDFAGSTNIGEDCVKSDETMDATWLNRPVSVAWPNRLANTYKEPTSTFSGYEESEIEVGEGLEEPSSDVRSEVRSGVNSEETNEKYGDCAPAKSHREEVLYNPIQTAPLQTEFQSSQRCGKPVRLSVRPSRFRYEAFETQFQPRRKKKLRRVCLHPGRGESSGFSSVDGDCDLTQKQRKEQKYFRLVGEIKRQ